MLDFTYLTTELFEIDEVKGVQYRKHVFLDGSLCIEVMIEKPYRLLYQISYVVFKAEVQERGVGLDKLSIEVYRILKDKIRAGLEGDYQTHRDGQGEGERPHGT